MENQLKEKYKCEGNPRLNVNGCGELYDSDPKECPNCGNTVFEKVTVMPDKDEGWLDKVLNLIG